MRPSTEAAMWRIAYRLWVNDQYAESTAGIKQAVNVDDGVFDRAIQALEESDIINQVTDDSGEGYKLDDEQVDGMLGWGDTMFKVLPRVQESTPRPRTAGSKHPEIQAKKAKAVLEATEKITMAGASIAAKRHAMEHIEEYLDGNLGGTDDLFEAYDWLKSHNRTRNVDANVLFEEAMDELEVVIDG